MCRHPNEIGCNAQPFQAEQAEALLTDPFTGWAWLPGYKGEWLSINSLGFRGDEVAVEKPEGTLRIAIVGGSAALGVSVHDDETIEAYLEAILEDDLDQPVEVINGAVTSFNSSQELAQVMFRLLPLDPDIIVEYGGRNDAYFALSPRWEPHYTPGLRDLQNSVEQSGEGVSLTPLVQYLADETAIGTAISQGIFYLTAESASTSQAEQLTFHPAAIEIYQQNIEWLASLLRQEGVPLILISQPTLIAGNKPITEAEQGYLDYTERYGGYLDLLSEHYPAFVAALQETGEQTGTPTYDFTDLFDETHETMYLDEAHLTPEGNRMVAQRLAEIILELLHEPVR